MTSPEMENIVKSFETVKAFVAAKHDLGETVLHFCDDAEKLYQESTEQQASEGLPPRVYAHVLHYPNTVCASVMMGGLSEEQRQGIFIHEFGHLFAEKYPFHEGVAHPLDCNDDGDADYVVTQVFGVHLHYDDDEIEYVLLPIGSEAMVDEEITEEEAAEVLEETEEEEEHSEYGLDLPSSEELNASIQAEAMSPEEEIEATNGTVIDLEQRDD